jgi:hypothetical protein
MKNMCSSPGAGKAKTKTGGETPLRTNLGEKTILSPVFSLCTVFILTSHFFTGFIYFTDNSIVYTQRKTHVFLSDKVEI